MRGYMKIVENLPSSRCGVMTPPNVTGSKKIAHEKVNEYFEKNLTVSHKNCPLCEQSESEFQLISKYDYQGFQCPIVVCSLCGFVFQSSYLNNDCLSENYEKYSLLIRGKSLDEKYLSDLFNERLDRFSRNRFSYVKNFVDLSEGDLVVEVGCNDGVNLMPYKEIGCEVIGFDLDKRSFSAGIKNGLDLRSDDFFKWLDSAEKKPKLLIFCHFLEHLSRPTEFLSFMSSNVPEGAHVFIEVPGFRDETWVNSSSGIIGYMQYEHLVCFEKASLCFFMNKASFSTIDCNEFVKGVFKKESKPIAVETPKSNAFEYLYKVESRWSRSLKRRAKDFIKKLIS